MAITLPRALDFEIFHIADSTANVHAADGVSLLLGAVFYFVVDSFPSSLLSLVSVVGGCESCLSVKIVGVSGRIWVERGWVGEGLKEERWEILWNLE